MKKRFAQKHLGELQQYFPVLVITGPRQSGKTTLARSFFPEKPYVSMENPDTRLQALDDPRSFLKRYPNGLILDEVQRTPELISYLQQIVDDNHSPGKYILTGSRQFGLRSTVSQSLAGRAAYVELLPFTLREWYGESIPDLDAAMYRGLYPPVLDKDIPGRIWFPQYTATYVERDVREILEIRDLTVFSRFIRMCAARVGQLLNLSSLANDCGITHNTAKSWIEVLEASYLFKRLYPWHENFNKRLIKTPKLYTVDTGLLCWLLGIESPDHLNIHPQRGSIFENWVIMEHFKKAANQGLEPNLYFWRDQAGHEIDLLQVNADKFHVMEIKSGMTFSRDWIKGLKYFEGLAGEERIAGKTLVTGTEDSFVQDGVNVIGWTDSPGKTSQ